ncbi:hypothetical protein SEA_PUPPER_137 [Gordonia phage Pupper]|uniref:Uncharacterized protein n=1 Tax=Gordonia phage Pupper TaxID=2571249 RepID=A0A4Y6EIS6_9CAUD|nr:hypothetical protein KHQ83_gp140 [Gordonia phage Pupper]QDF18623.1 hypothetical protein SEA_PUPPER_137 [Gordonia phage Pupper]
MLLNKTKLIETIDRGVERAKQDQVEWDQLVDAAEAEHNRRWREDDLPKLKPFRDLLTQRLKDKKPITQEEVQNFFHIPSYSSDRHRGYFKPFNRGGRRGYNRQWEADHNYGPRPVLQISSFETLRDFLETVADEQISTGQLEKAGFRSMHKLFQAAANGYWDEN